MTCVGFSHDGKYVSTADMSGLVQVWLAISGQLVWSGETADIEVSCAVVCLSSPHWLLIAVSGTCMSVHCLKFL